MRVHAPHQAPVYRTADVRAIEAAVLKGPDAPPLMKRAGSEAAAIARDMAGDSGRPVLVFAGPGNNGGDAFVLARELRRHWFNVKVVFDGDPGRLSRDASAALRSWLDAGGTVLERPPAGAWSLVVDGLFGIGLEREITGRYAERIAAINALGVPVLALDVPSGLHADTGRVLGCAVRAHRTATFIGLKSGLLTLDGPDHCGEIHVCPLGLDAPRLRAAPGALIAEAVLDGVLAPRRRNTHKGDYGSVGIIGGDHGMIGAALLAARAALRLGAGRVYAGLLAHDAPRVDPAAPELMLRTADEVLKLPGLGCLAVGPGLGQTPDAAFYLGIALQSPLPLVLDADALNLIAADSHLASLARSRTGPTLMTPHPAEAARLLGTGTRDVQHDRIAAATALASTFNAWAVLKGAGSICAEPGGAWHVNTSGNPGMASAGMGDVLTGMLAALLAQQVAPHAALLAGVHLHGAAADSAVATGAGPVGLTASEVTDAARTLLNRRTPMPLS